MQQRGRKSEASLAIVRNRDIAPLEVHVRREAPAELSDEETSEWYAIVESLPATWFGRENQALLTQYCRHVVRARRVAQLIHDMESPQPPKPGEDAPTFDIQGYNSLLIMQDRESRAIATLSTKMRIAQQSTIDKETKKKGVGKRPWLSES